MDAYSSNASRSVQADLLRGTIAEIKQLTVDRLRRLLRSEELQVSGVKNELQQRLIAHAYQYDQRDDLESLRRLRDLARGYPASNAAYNSLPNSYPSPYSAHTPASSASPHNFYNSPTPRLPPPSSIMPGGGFVQSTSLSSRMGAQLTGTDRLTFKNSPFFTIQKSLTQTLDLKAREQTRDTVRLNVILDDALATRFQTDPNCRAMVFCAVESFDSTWKPVDISFPQHSELRVNSTEIKANLKGLKNKPGSTRPVDITDYLRKKPNFPNAVELVYALTSKGSQQQKHLILVNLVQRKPIDVLVDELRKGKYLSRDRVVREMQARAKDDDIVATSSNMSLKDPVQMTRIETPCRSMTCKHTECFDAAVFLALQEQAPTWTCPICNRPAAWDTLVIDQFVQYILDNTPKDAEQVTVEPDGNWHLIKSEDDRNDGTRSNTKHQDSDDDDDDDDLVEIVDPSSSYGRPRAPTDSIRTPSINGSSFDIPHRQSSILQSQSTSQPQSQSKKRPREEVIDLTLSDDDEPPVSRIKRPSFSSQPSTDAFRPPGVPSGPFRFNLPVPVQRTDSPGHYYEFDSFNTTF